MGLLRYFTLKQLACHNVALSLLTRSAALKAKGCYLFSNFSFCQTTSTAHVVWVSESNQGSWAWKQRAAIDVIVTVLIGYGFRSVVGDIRGCLSNTSLSVSNSQTRWKRRPFQTVLDLKKPQRLNEDNNMWWADTSSWKAQANWSLFIQLFANTTVFLVFLQLCVKSYKNIRNALSVSSWALVHSHSCTFKAGCMCPSWH